ncbi:MAG: hypothetical protein Q8P56_04605 [Candidatus Uhrbacteria bacterium]|nr:hypothetical protein [Candidatus Uhrbacteria bacterium]
MAGLQNPTHALSSFDRRYVGMRFRYAAILAILAGFAGGIAIEVQQSGGLFPDPTPEPSPIPSPRPSYDPNSRQVLLADAEGEGTDEVYA